jgi:dihydrolipoamide dehydrogenase
MTTQNFDMIVLGAGPGGYVAAIRAAQQGQRVAIIEEKHLGGICLNWGCIPTKALLKSADVLRIIQHSHEYGIDAKVTAVHLEKIVQRSRNVAQKLSQGIEHLMKKNKITVFRGRGKIGSKKQDNHTLLITNDQQKVQEIYGQNIIIATGARPRILPHLQPNGSSIVTYKEAMIPEKLPQKLLVIGSGAIGIEFASFYHALGADVTVAEIQDRILPVEDREISALAEKSFAKQGIKIQTSTTVESLEERGSQVVATLKSSQGVEKISVDRVIVAVGVLGNTDDLGLEHTRVLVQQNQIVCDEYGQTQEAGVYAIGDVAGGPWLAHKASHEAIFVVDKIVGHKKIHPLNKKHIPGCTYSHPQIASIGWTEEGAVAEGFPLRVGKFPFMANGKAIALGETEGLIKLIFHKETGEILGAHMIGAEVTELIQSIAVAMTCEATEEELMHTIFPHPTLSEMIHESALNAFDMSLHI